jgi:hypothetical protein
MIDVSGAATGTGGRADAVLADADAGGAARRAPRRAQAAAALGPLAPSSRYTPAVFAHGALQVTAMAVGPSDGALYVLSRATWGTGTQPGAVG